MASEPDYEYLGCGDGNCEIQRPKGVHTNGGCMCLRGMDHEKRIRLRKAMRRQARLRELLRQALEGDAVTENGDWIAEVVDVLLYARPPVPEATIDDQIRDGAAACLAYPDTGDALRDTVRLSERRAFLAGISHERTKEGTDHDHT